jgi:hypothetical protein
MYEGLNNVVLGVGISLYVITFVLWVYGIGFKKKRRR